MKYCRPCQQRQLSKMQRQPSATTLDQRTEKARGDSVDAIDGHPVQKRTSAGVIAS